MASSATETMPQTVEAYKALAQRDLELIEEMKESHEKELSKLKSKVNVLDQRVEQVRSYNLSLAQESNDKSVRISEVEELAKAAKKFIDSHLADPDLSSEMIENYMKYTDLLDRTPI